MAEEADKSQLTDPVSGRPIDNAFACSVCGGVLVKAGAHSACKKDAKAAEKSVAANQSDDDGK